MIYYLNLFFFFFILSKKIKNNIHDEKLAWNCSIFILFIFLGSRYYIGGDYFGYMNLFNKMENVNFNYPFYHTEFLYYSILLIINKLGLSYYFSNFVFMFIFLFFFQLYAKRFKNPFYILLIAIPILFIPISVNFIRQATAISIFLYASNFLFKKEFSKYFFYIVVASLFHKFAILYLFFFLVYEKNFKKVVKYCAIISFILLIISFFAFFFKDNIFNVWLDKIIWHFKIYTDAEYPILPKGTIFRVGMISISLILLFYFRSFYKKFPEFKLWITAGLISILISPVAFIFPLMINRILIFFIPIVFFVFGNIIHNEKAHKIFSINLISLFFFIYFFVWLKFSPFKDFFTPYKSILFL